MTILICNLSNNIQIGSNSLIGVYFFICFFCRIQDPEQARDSRGQTVSVVNLLCQTERTTPNNCTCSFCLTTHLRYIVTFIILYIIGATILSQLSKMRAQLKNENSRVEKDLEREKVKRY